jgi:polysaccharide biosynthesis protein PslH
MPNFNVTSSPKVLLLTKQLDAFPKGGRELLCRLNYDALREIYDEQLVLFELISHPLKGVKAVLGALKGGIDGLDESAIASALQIIQRESAGKLFVDGSNLGGFVKAVREKLPEVEISTFFHNVEARFFLGALRQKKNLRALAVLIVNFLAERKSVRYSDKIICMSQRDSGLLKTIYGRQATHILPMALQDRMPADLYAHPKAPPEYFVLFVGSDFYGNCSGISWFVEHVVPHIGIKVCIVGRGFENHRVKLEREGKVEVVGAVDDLADWYRNAQFVIAPIFDGSGMKTKVAEALMYGKKIVGTPEAFSGYEDVGNRAGWICETANDFVAAIACAQSEVTQSFYPELRALYVEKYSQSAAVSRLAAILSE